MTTRDIAVLDACVLYSPVVRDLLLRLAIERLYKPRWTDRIQEEWSRAVLKNRKNLDASRIARTISQMEEHLPGAKVITSGRLDIVMPDANDIHVVEAAVHARASKIITFNMRHFAPGVISKFKVDAEHPDEFASKLIAENPHEAMVAFAKQVAHLKAPRITAQGVLRNLKKSNMPLTSSILATMI